MVGEIIFYQSEDGAVRLETRLENETLWLTINQMAELFNVDKSGISRHLKNIYATGELSRQATVANFATVQVEGDRSVERDLEYYNLDAIISVGYRVNSIRGTQFRIWATRQLKEYIIKGFVMDDERLKNPPVAGSAVPDYFDEMLARVRDIRASERRMYLRVREIFALAADYAPSLSETNQFFSTIQNKLHFAVTGMTAAEIIAVRVNHAAPNAGLSNWARDEVRKSDVTIAKNYLQAEEITELNRIVTMWLDFAEDQAMRRKQIFMQDWEAKLDDFLRFNDRDVLPHTGKISKKQADAKAHAEYELFAMNRRKEKEALGEKDQFEQLAAVARQIVATKTEKKS